MKNNDYFADNPTEALEKMKDKGIKDIYIQHLLIIEGQENKNITLKLFMLVAGSHAKNDMASDEKKANISDIMLLITTK